VTPFRTAPSYVAKVWAGRRLGDVGLSPAPPAGTGEAWLVADLPGAASQILDGPYAGRSLRDLVQAEPEALLGEASLANLPPGSEPAFPLLVKLLDVGTPLSVQVHPDREIAQAFGDGERGKCEAWLVVSAEEDGAVRLGLADGFAPADVPRLAASGGLPEAMPAHRPAPGEGIEIVPGTLHTAAGILVLEVQETSDVTYRVYDYGRGRELHLAQAQRCLERAPDRPPRPEPPGWVDGRRDLAPRCPFRFEAVQVGAGGGAVELGRASAPGVLVVLEGRLEVEGLSVGAGEALVCPAGWEGATALSPGILRAGCAVYRT
jgi:mannose-6-phosphate isomerase